MIFLNIWLSVAIDNLRRTKKFEARKWNMKLRFYISSPFCIQIPSNSRISRVILAPRTFHSWKRSMGRDESEKIIKSLRLMISYRKVEYLGGFTAIRKYSSADK